MVRACTLALQFVGPSARAARLPQVHAVLATGETAVAATTSATRHHRRHRVAGVPNSRDRCTRTLDAIRGNAFCGVLALAVQRLEEICQHLRHEAGGVFGSFVSAGRRRGFGGGEDRARLQRRKLGEPLGDGILDEAIDHRDGVERLRLRRSRRGRPSCPGGFGRLDPAGRIGVKVCRASIDIAVFVAARGDACRVPVCGDASRGWLAVG